MARGPVRAAVALAPLLLLLLVLARTPAARGGGQQQQQQQPTGGLHATLDSMARLMGEKRFDPGFLGRIDACLAKHRGAEFQDRYWEGFVTEGTNSSAEWGKKAPKGGRHHGFLEYNVTVMDVGVPVYEPCNFASNMVYYHTMVQICDREAAGGWAVSAPTVDALVTTYAGLAAGSALKHAAGQTKLGYVVDNLGIQLFTFISHVRDLGFPAAPAHARGRCPPACAGTDLAPPRAASRPRAAGRAELRRPVGLVRRRPPQRLGGGVFQPGGGRGDGPAGSRLAAAAQGDAAG